MSLLLGQPPDRYDARVAAIVDRRIDRSFRTNAQLGELLAPEHDVDLRPVPRRAADRVGPHRLADRDEPIYEPATGPLIEPRDEPGLPGDRAAQLTLHEPGGGHVRDMRDHLHAGQTPGDAPHDRSPHDLRVDGIEATLLQKAPDARNRD